MAMAMAILCGIVPIPVVAMASAGAVWGVALGDHESSRVMAYRRMFLGTPRFLAVWRSGPWRLYPSFSSTRMDAVLFVLTWASIRTRARVSNA